MSRPFSTPDPFRAVADPTRRRILDLLRQREHTVADLFAAFKVSFPTISRHLAVLRHAGMVQQRRQGTHRLYAIRREALTPVVDWAQRHRDRARV